MDANTRTSSIISYACIKVEAESINQIPKHMVLSLGEDNFDLLVEVEMGIGFFGISSHAGDTSAQGGGGEVRGDKLKPLDASFFLDCWICPRLGSRS